MKKDQEPRSRFTASLNQKAATDNKLPNMTGQFMLSDGSSYRFSAWANYSAKGSLYMKGTHTAQDLTEALIAQIVPAGTSKEGPAEIDLKPGEIILFENHAKHGEDENEAAEDKAKRLKRPDWYGYARTASGWYQLAAWAREGKGGPGFLAGSASEFKPSEPAAPATDQVSKGRSTRGHAIKAAPQI